MDTEKFIAAVKKAQADQALEGFLHPKQRDAFEYGLLSGVVIGMQRALDILGNMQDEIDGKNRPSALINSNPYAAGVDEA